MASAHALHSSWYAALTLQERLTARDSRPTVHDDTIAHKHLERWRAQRPFDDAPLFQERLQQDHLNEDTFIQVLGEPLPALAARFATTPEWMQAVDRLLQRRDKPYVTFNPTSPEQDMVRFLEAADPLLRAGLEKLRGGLYVLLRTYASGFPFHRATLEPLLFESLPERLLNSLNRTMVLELNVARLQGELAGTTPQARFDSFILRLRNRDVALSLFQEYPVLARQLQIAIDQWVRVSLEVVKHLCQDLSLLQKTFGRVLTRDMVTHIQAGGDQHNDGRSVRIITFASGFKLVYKPRSMAVDVHMQQLLHWLNEHGATPSFRVLRVLDRHDHGWVEFVNAAPCEDEAELHCFYQRQGGYLALLYALQATDFHFENLIASGEHPVLIDLESLFHPRDFEALEGAQATASQMLAYSVLRVGLLPQRVWGDATSDGIDISGLGGAAGQLSPKAVPTFTASATDEMRVVKARVAMEGGANRPTLRGADVNVVDYTDDLLKGFTSLYHLLLTERDSLLAPAGPLTAFANDEVRVILRPTRVYALLLQESFHPDVLRNALDRDRLFDRLWVEAAHRPALKTVIPAEREDLWRGDIPIFSTRPSTRDLWDSRDRRYDNYFQVSSLDMVAHRLRHLSDDDRKRQEWFIRASMTALSLQGHTIWSQYTPTVTDALASDAALVAAARNIGDHLALLACGDDNEQEAIWIGLSLAFERTWTLNAMGPDLYSGVSGMALFFAYLGHVTGEERYTSMARRALGTVRHQVKGDLPDWINVGGFSEGGGTIYALTHLGALWQDPSLLEEAIDIAGRLAVLIEKDTQYDVVGGLAGFLLTVLNLYHVTGNDSLLTIARTCGDRLVAVAHPMPTGVGWIGAASGGHALAGISHGAAGISYALFALAHATGNTSYAETAQAGIAYERTLFAPEAGNWRDLRHGDHTTETEDAHMIAWCHGAPGVGMGRVQTLTYWQDDAIHDEIRTALDTTLAHGFGMNHSLCHGDLGNLDLVLQAALQTGDATLFTQTRRIAASILNSIERDGWLCGVPLGVETPGLMTGLAGIGYGLLRVAAPHRVPSVLTLAAPIQAGTGCLQSQG